MSNPTVVVEVISPSSDRVDRFVKLREYRSVSTIRDYLIVEHVSVGIIAHHRSPADAEWTATPLVAGDVAALPELGISVPLAEFYEDTGVPNTGLDEGR